MAAMAFPPGAKGENSLLTMSISLTERYESNAGIAPRGSEKDDLSTNGSFGLNVSTKRKSYSLNGNYTLNGDYYAGDQGLNRLTHRLSGNISAHITPTRRTTLTLSDTVSFVPDSTEVTGTGLQTKRTDMFVNIVSASGGYTLSKRTTANLTVSDSVTLFDDPAFVDSRTDSVSTGLGFMLTENTTLNAGYAYTRFFFDSSPSSTTVESHNFTFGPSVSKGLTPTIRWSASAGAAYTPSAGDAVTLTVDTSLDKTFKKSHLGLAYSRGVATTGGLSSQVSVNDRVSASFSHDLTRRLSCALSADYSRSRSEPAGTIAVSSYNAGVTGNWRVTERVSASFGYTRSEQWSESGPAADLARNTVFLGVTATPALWRF